jgi:hypothetical protein
MELHQDKALHREEAIEHRLHKHGHGLAGGYGHHNKHGVAAAPAPAPGAGAYYPPAAGTGHY